MPQTAAEPNNVEQQARHTVLDRARAIRKRNTEELTKRVHALADVHMTKPDALDCPAPGEQIKVRWTAKEWDALYAGVAAIIPHFEDFTKLSEFQRIVLWGLITNEVQTRFFPAHRHRLAAPFASMPEEQRKRFSTLLHLEQEELKPAEAAANQVPVWTPEETTAYLLHFAHLLRKQNIFLLPQSNDRGGSQMFADLARLAQCNALPRHRRIDMAVNPRAVLDHLNLFPRLLPLLKGAPLPELPPKAPELETLVNEPAPLPYQPEAHQSLPPLPKVASIEEFTDDEICHQFTKRLLARNDHIARLEKMVGEVQGMNNLLLDDNEQLRALIAKLDERLTVLEKGAPAPVAVVEKKALPRVAIVACRKYEFDRIVAKAREFGLVLLFRHYDQDDKPKPVNADYSLALKWGAHEWDKQAALAGIPRDRRAFAGGSVTKAVEQLQAWFAPSTHAA